MKRVRKLLAAGTLSGSLPPFYTEIPFCPLPRFTLSAPRTGSQCKKAALTPEAPESLAAGGVEQVNKCSNADVEFASADGEMDGFKVPSIRRRCRHVAKHSRADSEKKLE